MRNSPSSVVNMDTYTIKVDGKLYQGESTETIAANIGGNGWHVSNHGAINVLRIGGSGEPKQIIGRRNLRSDIERILRWIEIGMIDGRNIEIHKLD